jgi:hypothetical protein
VEKTSQAENCQPQLVASEVGDSKERALREVFATDETALPSGSSVLAVAILEAPIAVGSGIRLSFDAES